LQDNDDQSQLENRVAQAMPGLAAAMEQQRRRYLHFLFAGTLVATAAVTFLGWPFTNAGNAAYFMVAIATLLPVAILYLILDHFYRRGTKRSFTAGLTAATGFAYHPDGLFDMPEIARHKILPPHHIARREDGFEGFYRGVAISLQEIILSDMVPDPGQRRRRKREQTVFWGVLIRLKIKRPVGGHTVVMPSSALQTFLRTRFSDFAPVRLVSNRFSKKYDVMSTDQIEARVVLNPAFMERFMEARKILRAKWAEVSFLDNEILFAVQRFRPVFEPPPLWQPVTTARLSRRADELTIVFRMIDVLKLNPQVGL